MEQCDNVRASYDEILKAIQDEVYAGEAFVNANKGRYECGGYIYTGKGQDVGQFWAKLAVGNAKLQKVSSNTEEVEVKETTVYIKEQSAPKGFELDATAFLETFFKLYPTATEKELAYYVQINVLEPINGDYLYSELINPIFTQDGENVSVIVSVKFLDNQTKATQISQFELVLHKDSNWEIVD